jgi:hypothetical protein
LEPQPSNFWTERYPQRADEYPAYSHIRTPQKAKVTDFKMTDLGALRLKGEGEAVSYDDPLAGPQKEYVPVRWALAYGISDEATKHDLYSQLEKVERGLIKSAVDLQETTAALLLNNAFGTTDADGFTATGFDGLALCSTAHTRLDGGATWRNRPSTDADLGVTSLQNAVKDFEDVLDDRGRPVLIKPKLLVISSGDKWTAKELLGSEYKPGTANNEINALKDEGLTFMISHYKSDADSWFLFAASGEHDCNFIWETRPRTGMEEDWEREIIKRKVVEGFVVGHGESRGVWGSSGG